MSSKFPMFVSAHVRRTVFLVFWYIFGFDRLNKHFRTTDEGLSVRSIKPVTQMLLQLEEV